MTESIACIRCGQTQPATPEFFCADPRLPSGATNLCLDCGHANAERMRKDRGDWTEQEAQELDEWGRWHEGPTMAQRKKMGFSHQRSPRQSISVVAQRLFEKQNGRCFYCGKPLGEYFEVDHMHPKSRGGPDKEFNYCLACKHCNLQKLDKTPEEYLAWLIQHPEKDRD